jgi:hypothetical protein
MTGLNTFATRVFQAREKLYPLVLYFYHTMASLGSAVTLSTIAYAFKGLSKVLPKRFDVRGLPTLLEALREKDPRRGVVTSWCVIVSLLRPSMQSQLGGGRSSGTCMDSASVTPDVGDAAKVALPTTGRTV